jgi:hypothetical protein
VLSYVRSSWGNQASAVTAGDIQKLRATLGAHPQPLSGEQMKSLSE